MATGITTARVFDTNEEALSVDADIVGGATASELESELGDVPGPHAPRHFTQMPPLSPEPLNNLNPGTTKRSLTNEEGSFEPVVFFAKKKYKLSAYSGRNSAVSVPVNTVLDTGAEPNFIRNKRVYSAWHRSIRPVEIPGLPDSSKLLMKSCCLTHFTVRTGIL